MLKSLIGSLLNHYFVIMLYVWQTVLLTLIEGVCSFSFLKKTSIARRIMDIFQIDNAQIVKE